MRVKKKIENTYRERIWKPLKLWGKPKIFCIGRNKTGTTSFKKAFEDLDFIVGNQIKAEYLLSEYKNENFDAIIKYCKTAQVFQDFPFSFPETYKHLDKAFPKAKFILTVRDSPEQWYDSLVKFQSKRFGKNGRVPTKEDLQEATYRWKGRPWETKKLVYGTPEDDIFNKEILIQKYKAYNQSVQSHFEGKPEKLLTINIAEDNSYQKLMDFLAIDSPYSDFPWENPTKNIKTK